MGYLVGQEIPFHEFVRVINNQLEPLGFKISMGRLEHDGSEWVGLVNSISDSAAKKGSSNLMLVDLEFFRHCVRDDCL